MTRRARSISRWTFGCAAGVMVALAFVVVAGVVWWRSEHNAVRTLAATRDIVSIEARLDIATVNTADFRRPTTALENWLDVSTGPLHQQFADSRTAATKLLGAAKMATRATVLDAAVVSLDLQHGTASVIASVDVTRTPESGSASTIRNRFRASLTRVHGQWKLSDLAIVPVGLS